MFVRSPSGDFIRLYISRDKNEKTVFGEQCTKRLCRAMKDTSPDLDLHMLKKDFTVAIGWESIAKVEVSQFEGKKISEIKWINRLVEQFNIDKDAVVNRYKLSSSSAGAELPWSL